ncbi:hypothetical protein IJG14_00240 [bacterium]|nr:hypothetical protein [bacterium]
MKKIIKILILIVFIFVNTGIAESANEKVFMSQEEVIESEKFLEEPEDVQKARYEAFKNVKYQIDPKTFEKYLKDKKFVAPPKKQGGKPKLKPRFGAIEIYDNNTYSVFCFNKLYNTFIYSTLNGNLIFFSNDIILNDYNISYFYNLEGLLFFIEAYNNRTKQAFVFSAKKNYIGFEKDNILFLQDGNKINMKIFQIF